MNTVNPHTGEKLYNKNERARMRGDRILRAEPLSPEEEERAQQERRIALNNEKKKESAWTETKLKILAMQGASKRVSDKRDPKEADMPAGSIREDLARVEPVLFERLGEPREFIEDINMILNGFENERLVIEGNEMQKLNEYGKKYLLGLLIQRHIFDQGFSIGVDTNNQPVLRDERGGSNIKRQEQMKGLQDALGQFEFSKNVRNILKKNDNTSLVAEYIAANTYEKHPNLVDYRNSLARKMGITSPNISPDQAKTITESTSLTPEEKSFLLAWKDSKKDGTLTEVQKQQETFVKYAKENIDKKTPETHLRELAEKPFTKSAQLLAGGAIGAALLYFAYKQIKKGGIWGTISGLIAGLIGGAIMLPLGDKAWKGLGMSDALKNIQEGKPVDREQASDHSFENMDIIAPIKTNLSRLQARIAGSQEGIQILMNPKVGNKIGTEYPVYSMLGVLNPDKTTLGNTYAGPMEIAGAKTTDITKGFKELSQPDQPNQLNTILTDTWTRYQKTEKFRTQNEQERKSAKLSEMLAVIEKEDGWLNRVIDVVSDEPEKKEALKVIGQNPAAWGQLSMRQIRQGILRQSPLPGGSPLSAVEQSAVDALTNGQTNGIGNEIIMKKYAEILYEKVPNIPDTQNFRETLLKK